MLSFTVPAIGRHYEMGEIPAWWKLAQKPSILDPFHFRELCHMLTVIHEALLAQRGVWQNRWGCEGGRVGINIGIYSSRRKNMEDTMDSLEVQHQRP